MGHIRIRKETGKLYFDFTYQNLRCREQTSLSDTSANRKKLEQMLERIEAEITLGVFDYASYFPNSKRLEKVKAVKISKSKYIKGIPTCGEFIDTWYGELRSTWRFSYRVTVKSIIRTYLKPKWNDELLDEITKADLMQYRAELCKVKRPDGEVISNRHINRIMTMLKAILEEASDRFDFVSPYRGIKPLKAKKPQIEPFSLDEVYMIINNVRNDYKNYYTVRFFTGMRTGEIDGLQWQYIDFERRQILIRETFVENRIEYTKTDAGQREIMMSEPVYQALLKQREVTGNGIFVFCNSIGTPLNYQNITKRVWYPILKYLGLKKRRPYQSRHTAATLWLASGENPEWIARQMGHSNTQMLFQVYSRYVPNLTRQDGSAFERLLEKKKDS